MKIGYVVLCLVGMALVMGALAWLISPWAHIFGDWYAGLFNPELGALLLFSAIAIFWFVAYRWNAR